MERNYVYIKNILEAIAKVEEYVAGKTKEDFLADSRTADAVAFQIGVIGETASKISEDEQARYPHIPWYKVRGMRNRIFHDYIGIDWEVVWETAVTALPDLKKSLLEKE